MLFQILRNCEILLRGRHRCEGPGNPYWNESAIQGYSALPALSDQTLAGGDDHSPGADGAAVLCMPGLVRAVGRTL